MHVLYATDGDDPANDVGEVIVAAGDRNKVNVTVLSVVPTGPPTVAHLPDVLQSKETLQARADRAAEAAAARLTQAGFTVEAVTVERRPNEVIASLARDRGADVVALGAGPRSLIVGRFLGSVATDLLHGPMPLLIAREAPTADRVRVVVGTDGSGHADRAIGLASQFLDPERCDVTIVSVAVLDHRGPGGALRRLCDLRTERGDPGQGHRTRMGVRRAGRDDHAGPPL